MIERIDPRSEENLRRLCRIHGVDRVAFALGQIVAKLEDSDRAADFGYALMRAAKKYRQREVVRGAE